MKRKKMEMKTNFQVCYSKHRVAARLYKAYWKTANYQIPQHGR